VNSKIRHCVSTNVGLLLVLGVSLPIFAQIPGPKDTFASAKLSDKEARQIIAAVESSAYDTADSWTDELRVKRVDLGNAQGLVVRGTKLLCGATGNCQTWVFRHSGDNWLSLFGAEEAPIVESVQLGPGTTNGIKDLIVRANSSADASQRTTYRFNGREYRSK
jgi:hypothetical protein